MSRFLTILEVSQKQAYIFGSNKVADNIVNSAVIAKCLSPQYISETLKENYSDAENMVYSGGGHTILEFKDEGIAKRSVSILTEKVFREFDGLEVFAKTVPYKEDKSPRDNLKNLTAELEKKKALRVSGFHHGSFGIERIDADTLLPVSNDSSEEKSKVKKEEYTEAAKDYIPEGYNPVYEFGDLGIEKNKSGFIAVVHIDGNGMGKRVDELYDVIPELDWTSVKKGLRDFSDAIDCDFKEAYKDMVKEVDSSLKNGSLKDKLELKTRENRKCFPIRRIITAGDDICFVTEGRIGLECARIFIQKLADKTNKVDKKSYSACAGVAIVHQKYPFYKAYELAEKLCSSAKKEGAKISPKDDGRNVCSIDWHIEYGEIKDSIEEIKKDYISYDGECVSNKPYVIRADVSIEESKKYETFRENILLLMKSEKEIGNGKIKQLRSVIKKGTAATENYMKYYRISDDIRERLSFDAIELMDTFFAI